MSYSLSPKLPLVKDPQDGGYEMNKTYVEMIKQNLKMLILTAPGERIMEPFFGVGLRNYLFENNVELTRNKISSSIIEQVNTYMPFVEILNIDIVSDIQSGISENGIYLNLNFRIVPLDFLASIEINASLN